MTGRWTDRRLLEGRRLPEERLAKTDMQTARCLMCGLWYDDMPSAMSMDIMNIYYVTKHVQVFVEEFSSHVVSYGEVRL